MKALVLVSLFLSFLSCSSCASAQNMNNDHMDHANASGSPVVSETQDWAKQRLAKSPRHQEWVKVKNGKREVNCFVVYPEIKNKATAVLVIHEIFGMSDWVKSLTDQLAEAGYIAIAPDLLSGMGPAGGGTEEIVAQNSNGVGKAIQNLPPDQITADLDAVANYIAKVPGANGNVVVAGFCWGGGQTFRYATNNPNLKAAFVFYGPTPSVADGPDKGAIDKAALARIKAPVYGFYAENDARIDAMLPGTIAAMKEAGKTFEPVTYAGAGHGFMRAGEDPANTLEANKKARTEAWNRWMDLMKKF